MARNTQLEFQEYVHPGSTELIYPTTVFLSYRKSDGGMGTTMELLSVSIRGLAQTVPRIKHSSAVTGYRGITRQGIPYAPHEVYLKKSSTVY